MILLESVVMKKCDSCGTNVDIKMILANFEAPPTGISLCTDCRETLKYILIDDSDEDYD